MASLDSLKELGKGNTRFLSLEHTVVFGRDRFVSRQPAPEILPISKSFTLFGGDVRQQILAIYGDRKDEFPSYFVIGDSVATIKPTKVAAVPPAVPPIEHFNHLSTIEVGWQTKDIIFSVKAGKLTGIKTTWVNGVPKTEGNMGGENDSAYKRCEFDLASSRGAWMDKLLFRALFAQQILPG